MSIINKYARKVDAIAKTAFDEYLNAENAYNKAQENLNLYPQRTGFISGEYAAKHARVHAEYLEAKEALAAAKRSFNKKQDEIQQIRKELAAEIEEKNSVDPAMLDTATLELLKSGILTAYDYSKLLDEAQAAGNSTMIRLIGKHAEDAATARANQYGQNDPESRSLRFVSYQSQMNINDDLQAFDSMASLYNRCVNNPRMINYWDEFTHELTQGDADPAEPAENN